MLQSETLVGSVWLLVVLFIAFNGFFFFDIAPRYHYNDIDVLDLRVCYNGEWYNTRFVPPTLIETILQSPQVDNEHKVQLQKWLPVRANFPSTIFLRWPAQKPAGNKKCAPSRYALLSLNCWFLTSFFTPLNRLKTRICFTNHV